MNNITLLENGLDYILNTLKKLEEVENKKHTKYTIKYIIRDLISGIEIVLKYRLQVENWIYVVDNLDNITINEYSTGNFNSATLEKAIDRLDNLCKIKIKKEDIKILKELKSIRNMIEHFNYNLNEISTIILVNNCISIILKFINNDSNNFKLKFTKEEREIFNKINNKILKLESYLAQKENDIKTQFSKAPFEECPRCHKECLLEKKDKAVCYLCDSEFSVSSYKRIKYIRENQPSYREINKGASPIEEKECPNCDSIIVWDYGNRKAICFDCGLDDSIENIQLCERCQEVLHTKDIGICSKCFDYVVSQE